MLLIFSLAVMAELLFVIPVYCFKPLENSFDFSRIDGNWIYFILDSAMYFS